ncbi:hypothetical protein [Rhodococcus sp. B10]|uniref:hypothetical protein n=1 Tax=Rhodococcus sp. B10 TaxID=2695876 RepID=UPI0014310A63|nr:hypothetical protein [Rhodococcus sp. B10]NIL77623.1 hypothetical protein [Rhodococcus sp. B10]
MTAVNIWGEEWKLLGSAADGWKCTDTRCTIPLADPSARAIANEAFSDRGVYVTYDRSAARVGGFVHTASIVQAETSEKLLVLDYAGRVATEWVASHA